MMHVVLPQALYNGFVGAACVLFAAGVHAQAGPSGQPGDQKPQLSEEAFKNVQVLKGIPVKEFMGTMGFFSASLALNCTDCHGGASASDWANYAIDTPLKNRARQMMAMVKSINDANFGGRPYVTCYTCHRGSQRPKVIPGLAIHYGEPPPDDILIGKIILGRLEHNGRPGQTVFLPIETPGDHPCQDFGPLGF